MLKLNTWTQFHFLRATVHEIISTVFKVQQKIDYLNICLNNVTRG